ncbi:MAG: SRPBCC family protein [Actinomycetota bacterium]
MTVLRRTVDVTKSLDETWAFLSDFASSAVWDPGVASARKATDGPIGVGTSYDLEVTFNGRTLPMTYTVTAWEPKRRVVLEGRGSTVRATDTITFEATASGTRIGYTADLRLPGVLRVMEPFMGKRFDALADAAMDGLRRSLA